MMTYYSYDTKIGTITIICDGNFVSEIRFGNEGEGIRKNSYVSNLAIREISDYLDGKRKVFNIKVKPDGTDFQKSVWDMMMKIPYGKTKTYKELAMLIGDPNASRAIGNACNKNPIPIVIPCHRVIGSDGDLTGYAGGLDIKKYLLNLETNNIISQH